jgi:hypothetical protein
MPNLNKVRGVNKGPNSGGLPHGSRVSTTTTSGRPLLHYGLSRPHNSDPRIQQQQRPKYQQQQQSGVPSRGTVASKDVRIN